MATAPKAPAPSLPRRTEYYAGGVLVYTVDGAGAVFLLLGLERRRDKGWSYMVGKVDRGERTLAACAREMHEETAGCYSLDRAAMRQLPCMAYDQQLLFFAPAVHVDARVLEALAHRAFAEGRYAFGEMTEYLWVSLADLRAQSQRGASEVDVRTMDGQQRRLKLRSFVPRALEKAERAGILNAVASGSVAASPMLPNDVACEVEPIARL